MENNFIVEEYLINITQNLSKAKKYYIVRKYSRSDTQIQLIENNKKSIIKLDNIESLEEREVVEKYLRKVSTASLKYATSYLNSLLRNRAILNIIDYGNAKEAESFTKEENHYKVVRYYYDVKGNMFYKIMGEKWNKKIG